MEQDIIYFDYAATTPVRAEAIAAMTQALARFGNPSSRYAYGREAAQRVKEDRETVAAAMGCAPAELFFTSCGTEGDNWAVRRGVEINRRRGKHIVTTAIEHAAVLETCKDLERQGYEVTYLKPDRAGRIVAEQFAAALRPDTVLVSMMLVNNETGTLLPVAECVKVAKAYYPAILFHCDAVQGFLKVPFPLASLGADMMTVSGHKIGAPKGVGALYLGPRVKRPRPLLAGGGQENGLRSGTEATAQMAGFAKAAELRMEHRERDRAHLEALHAYAREKLSAIPDLVFVGGGTAPHILSVSLAGWPSQNIVNDLGAQGICVSAGSACHQGKPSHVVAALKLPKRVSAGVIRLSFGPETTEAEIDACAQALRRHHDTRMPML